MRTPSLRNIALSAPYMHNGMFADLKTVIDHYNRGGEAHPGQDPRIAPLHLSAGDKVALRAFLESLTGSNADALAADARSAPIGDN